MLAEEVARALGRPLLQWHVKSTTKAHQGLYEYDAVSRLRDSAARRREGPRHPQLHRAGHAVAGLRSAGARGGADRRDRQGRHRIPNDLLRELDRMEFQCTKRARPSPRATARW